MRFLVLLLVVCLLASSLWAADAPAGNAAPATPANTILFKVRDCMMAVGRDGNVYLTKDDAVLRMAPDGSHKMGGKTVYATWNVTANAASQIATANAHFNHCVNVWSPTFEKLGSVDDFLNSDAAEWFCPCDVQAGVTDFYGLDLNRNRIVRVAPPGTLVTTYPLKATGEDFVKHTARLRVWEDGKRLYLATQSGKIYVLDFDGKLCWSLNAAVSGNRWDGYLGAFDVDKAGQLLVINANDDTVQVYDTDAKPPDR